MHPFSHLEADYSSLKILCYYFRCMVWFHYVQFSLGLSVLMHPYLFCCIHSASRKMKSLCWHHSRRTLTSGDNFGECLNEVIWYVIFSMIFFRLIELILHRLSYLQYHWLFLLLFQIVMVVDARDPLFYRCPDLEVTLSLPTCWYLLIELSWSISTINVKICSETGICTRNWWA